MKLLLVAHYLLPHSGGIEALVDRETRLLAEAGLSKRMPLCDDIEPGLRQVMNDLIENGLSDLS